MEQILESVRAWDGLLELAPGEGSEFPEIAWGDHFFYFAPDGQIPQRVQPYATVVTKDYPGDTVSALDPATRWRLNIHVGSTTFEQIIGEAPKNLAGSWDFSATDVVIPHPLYRSQGYIAIVNPGAKTTSTAIALFREAHENARRRALNRAATSEAETRMDH